MIKKRIRLISRRIILLLPLRISRTILFWNHYKYIPDVRRPVSFYEKLHYRILYDRRPILVTASSKVDSKKYVQTLNIKGLNIPETLWHGSDLNSLLSMSPQTDWILKPSHRSGSVLFGKNGQKVPLCHFPDLAEWLSEREYKVNKLWAYKEVKRELILEEKIVSPNKNLLDYKFYVFKGRIGLLQVHFDRFEKRYKDSYDSTFKFMPIKDEKPYQQLPLNLNQLKAMATIAGKVGREFDFVRVDLYWVEGKIYFGELTIYPAGGLLVGIPPKLDLLMGKMWDISGITEF